MKAIQVLAIFLALSVAYSAVTQAPSKNQVQEGSSMLGRFLLIDLGGIFDSLGDLLEDILSTVGDVVDELGDFLGDVSDDVDDLLGDVGSELNEALTRVGSDLEDTLENVKDQLLDKIEDIDVNLQVDVKIRVKAITDNIDNVISNLTG